MKALTLWQPWAWAICRAGKDIENRSWHAPRWLIGQRFAIHAAKRRPDDASVVAAWGMAGRPEAVDFAAEVERAPRGAVVATAVLTGVVTESDSPWFVGPYGWVLEDVQELPEAIPCRGRQGLWNLPPGITPAPAPTSSASPQ